MLEADFASYALARHLRQRVLRVFYNTHIHFSLLRLAHPLPELCRLRSLFAQDMSIAVKSAEATSCLKQ
jgi:hypothetical protein